MSTTLNSPHPEDLSHLADVLLFAGSLLMANGAPSQRTHDTLIRMAHHLGCPCVEVAVAYDSLILTLADGPVSTSRIKALPDLGVNFNIVAAVTQLCHTLESEAFTLSKVRLKLEQIAQLPHPCPLWLMPFFAGTGCAAVGQILGGDVEALWVDFLAACLACFAWLLCMRPSISPYITNLLAATVAGLVVGFATELGWTTTPATALSASVLFLVPGVPMICGLLDIFSGQIPAGHARLMNMLFFSLSIALGLLLSMQIIASIFYFI